MLLIIIVILVTIDLLILLMGTAVPASRLKAELAVDQELRKNVSCSCQALSETTLFICFLMFILSI